MVFDSFVRFRLSRAEHNKPVEPTPNGTGNASVTATVEKQGEIALLSIKDLPAWSDPNPFILTGYRPESGSWRVSLTSWTYPHNETGNIFSHLLPAVLLALVLGQGSLFEYLRLRHGEALADVDVLILSVQLMSGLACLLTSTMYHTCLNHSECIARRWLQMDYVGIIALMLGNFMSGLHFGFYCKPSLKYFYWGVTAMLGLTTAAILLSPRFRGPKYRLFRLSSFIATGLSAFAPIGHAWVLWGPVYARGIGLPYYFLEGLFLIIGCYLWERRLPERLYPGRFDLWGHSHTMWHVFVTLAIGAHTAGLLSAMDFTYTVLHLQCPSSLAS